MTASSPTRYFAKPQLQTLLDELRAATAVHAAPAQLQAAEAARWVASFPFPDFEQPYEFVSLSHPDEYPMNEGDIVSSHGLRIPVTEYDRHFMEEHVAHSTAFHAVRRDRRTPYFLGPLARVNLHRDRLFPTAKRLADEVNFPTHCRNPFQSIIARSLELLHA